MQEKAKFFPAAPVLILVAVLSMISIMGCTHTISKEARDMAVNDIPFQWIAENPERYRGAFVIWGGEIINLQSLGEGTLIEVLQRPLGRSEEPDETKISGGRFLVLYDAGFLDPALFQRGVKITVAGIVEGRRMLRSGSVVQMGELNYAYPYLIAREVYLWENERMMNQYLYPYY
ncbi:MAG: Slp family lipoprotein [bacterium]